MRFEDLPARSEGLPARSEGLPARFEGLPARSEDLPARSEDLPAKSDSQSTRSDGLGGTNGRTDGRTISPFYRTSTPTGAAAQKGLKTKIKSKVVGEHF